MTSKSTLEILTEAKGLLVTKGWTQGCCARDHRGAAVNPEGPYASCFCSLGAIIAVEGPPSADQALTLALPNGYRTIPGFNDARGRTLEEVLAVFDKAIAAETIH